MSESKRGFPNWTKSFIYKNALIFLLIRGFDMALVTKKSINYSR